MSDFRRLTLCFTRTISTTPAAGHRSRVAKPGETVMVERAFLVRVERRQRTEARGAKITTTHTPPIALSAATAA